MFPPHFQTNYENEFIFPKYKIPHYLYSCCYFIIKQKDSVMEPLIIISSVDN